MKNEKQVGFKEESAMLTFSRKHHGIFYSGSALAAQVNNVPVPDDGVITNEWLNTPVEQGGPGSQKFIIAQGDKVVIATHSDVKQLISGIQSALNDTSITGTMNKVNAIRQVLAENNIVIGVVGGEGQLENGVNELINAEGFDLIKGIIENDEITIFDSFTINGFGLGEGFIDKIVAIDTANGEINFNKNTNITIGGVEIEEGKIASPVVVGLVGGDLAVNVGLESGIILDYKTQPSVINRYGDVTIDIASGNVLAGIGGSAAASASNISVALSLINGGEPFLELKEANSNVTLNGNVTTNVYDKANLGAFANGGGAIAVGGTAISTVTGDTELNIIGGENVMKDGIDGVNVGVAGGGVALTTIGGEATSTVEGSTTINAHNGLAVGVIGGGVAGSGDATGAVELIQGGQVGHNDGTADKDISLGDIATATIKVEHAIDGGTATATTGDTNINLTGNTTAIGVIGGGVAAASHTFTIRPETDGAGEVPEGQNVNDALGFSNATAESGKATIVVNLESADPDNVAANIGGALGGIIDAATSGGDVTGIINGIQSNVGDVVGQGAAVGVFGGGVAFGHGSLRGTIDGKGEGALATATTDGADIILKNGYAAGVFGGGAAVTLNNAKAEATSNDVNIHVGEGMKAIGVFGGGLALSMEGERGADGYNGTTNGTLASSTVNSNNIEIYGDVDGVFGGGMAIGNSNLGRGENISDAVASVGTSNITVNSGTIDNLNIKAIMDATKNDNTDKAPWWSSLGMNASMAMNDLKGITDETSIAAGGLGMGMTGAADVKTANVTINGGTVKKDILGGGIAVDNMRDGSGAHVGISTITLNGGTVEGSVYAGGAINGTTPQEVLTGWPQGVEGHKGYETVATSSTVDEATVILNGATVNGEISGQGYESKTNYNDGGFNPYTNTNVTYDKIADPDSVGKSTLIIRGNNTLSPLDSKGDYTGTSKIHSFNIINVKDGSVTTLEGLTTDSAAIIDATGTEVKVDGSAKLDINDFKAGNSETGNEYKVISNTDAEDDVWTNDNLVYDRTEAYAQNAEKDGEYTINYKTLNQLTEDEKADAVNDFVGSLGEGGDNFEGTANGIIRNGENTNAGAKDFFGDYTKGEGTSRDLAAMAMIGEAAGVTSNTIDVAGDMADNSVLRLSFTQDDITGEPKVNEDGAIWAKYIHNKHDLDGMASSFGSVDSSSDFDGATIGVDFAKKGKVQSGIAFSYGSGDSHGMGINNDFDMWGVSLYGNVKNDDTNVIADIGFSESDNELTGTAMGKDIKADRDVSVFTVGVRAEKLYTNGSTQIVPYTGLRYYNVDPDSYTAYYDGQKFGEYDADRQNVWTLPVGVSLRNETVTESGWRLTPKVDVAYIWAFGDTDNSFDLNTGSGVDTLDYTVMDSGSWLGSVGFEAGKDDWAFGVGYSYQKGSHEEANKWFVNVEYSF